MVAAFVVGRMIASALCAFYWHFFTFFAVVAVMRSTTFNAYECLLQYDFEWPYCWHLKHCMILFLFTRGGSIFMILFCNPFMFYIYFLFYAGSKSTKSKFNSSLVVLYCAFIMLRILCPSSNSSCLTSSLSVE